MKVVSVVCLGFATFLASAPSARADVITDPTGDTFNTGTIDVTSVATNLAPNGVTPTGVQFTINFASAVAAPSAFAPNSVVGFIDLDTDRKASTGGTLPWGGPVVGGNNWINFFIPPNPGTPSIPGPTVGLGDEYYIDLGSELFHPGLVDVVSAATNLTVGVTPITYSGTSVSLTIPFALTGGAAQWNYGLLVGDFLSATDRVPNGALAPSTPSIPEPATLGVFGAALIGLAGYRRRVRPTT